MTDGIAVVTAQDIDTTDSMDPFLSHLFVPDDTPKDVSISISSMNSALTCSQDLLDAIHAYASYHYASTGLIVPPKPSYTPRARPSETKPTIEQVPVESDEDDGLPAGSEYQASDTGQGDPSVNGNSTVEVKRKRGGQRGKRKLKDMHLALDGSALLALGEWSARPQV